MLKKYLIKLGFTLGVLVSFMAYSGTGLLFNVTNINNILNINTTIPNHTYYEAGISINTKGYSIQNVGTDCILITNGYCLFTVSNTASKSITIQGPVGTVNFNLCLNGKGPLSCQNFTKSIGQVVPMGLAYITNDFSLYNDVTKCTIDTDGTLIDCAYTGSGFSKPFDITINSAGTFAYVANFSGTTVSRCSFNASGELIDCIAAGTFNSAGSVAIAPNGNYAYVPTTSANNVYKCTIEPNGTFSSCAVTVTGFNVPQRIIINSAGTYAYISSYGDDSITKCTINAGGDLISCASTGSGFSSPEAMAINAAGNVMYISNFNGQNISKCAINGVGDLSGCTDASGTIFNFPEGLAFDAAKVFLYVTDPTLGTVYKCSINGSGDVVSCGTAASGINGATSIYLT